MRRRSKVLAAAALLGLLASCAAPPKPPPPAPPPPPPAVEPPPVDRTTAVDRLCRPLLRIVEALPQGFSPLRAGRAGERAWTASLTPEPFRACTIEGTSAPGAEYVCRGQAIAGGRAALLEPEFARLARDLDACLARAEWFPMNWQRGEVMQFAGGERQLMWRDLSPNPRPAVLLNIREDIGTRVYYLQLTVLTLR